MVNQSIMLATSKVTVLATPTSQAKDRNLS